MENLFPKNTISHDSSFNSFGQTGLIQTPSADSRSEGTVSLILNRNDMWKFGTLTVSPFDWLEAGYFYYRPSDLKWDGDYVRGHYLDKGFNIKLIHRSKNKYLPNLAIGLDDFAGTGFFSREYVVTTKEINNLKFSLGIGWGKFTGENSFENPLSSFFNNFSYRPIKSINQDSVGKATYDQWFRGDASIFGGIEYKLPKLNSLKIKLEFDPFDYLDFSANNRLDALYSIRKKDSNINVGLSYSLNEFLTVDTSFLKGNTINISFVLSLTMNKKLTKKKDFKANISSNGNKDSNPVDSFYKDLLLNLNNNNLLLQTSSLSDDGKLDISISTSQYRNAIRSSSYAAYISNEVAHQNNIDLSVINVSHINAGVELNNITYISSYFDKNNNSPIELKIRNTTMSSGDSESYLKDEFQPNVNFPVIFSSISPVIVSHIGNPEKFYFGGINLQYASEVQFKRNLLLSTELNMRVYDNFRDTISGPGSKLQHVRTDIVDYLKEDDIYISRLQLDYIWSPYKNLYAKLSGGIFEQMFGGYGGEILYKPFNGNFNVGAELFYVKQRSFKQRFKFKEYNTVTGHINIGYKLLKGIESNLSYGRYLAKDDGFTFDVSRTTKSGFKSGIYFTRTNISEELFGEGSFDKGFYFQIPLDLFSSEYKGNYSSIKISPLTRDGGAKLIHDKDLKGLIYNSTNYELVRQWEGFLN